jgi:hypothetical protein
MDPTALLLAVLLIVVVSVAAGYLAWKVQAAQVAVWTEFARRHGLRQQRLRLEGSFEGVPLTVETQSRGSGKHRYVVAVVRLSVRDVFPPEFSLEREGLGDKVLKLFGKTDPEIGDEEFDRLFDLKNLSPEVTAVLHDKRVQKHLYSMASAYQAFSIRGGYLQAEKHRVPARPEELEQLIRPALEFTRTLEQAPHRSS